MRFPSIDYDTHPAYERVRSDIAYDDGLIGQHVRAADDAYSDFCSLADQTEAAAAECLARIRGAADRILAHAADSKIPVVAEEWLHNCTRWAVHDIAYEFARRVFSAREYRSRNLSASQAGQLDSLRARGMYVAELAPAAYERIRRLAMAHLDELKSQVDKSPSQRAVVTPAFNSPLWRAIKAAVEEAAIMDVLGEFKRNRMTMLGAGLEYSSPKQTWYQNIYADMGLPDGPLQYLHFDEGYCLPKAMIYVTPVTELSGPTRAIPASNCWQASEFTLRLHRALDRIVGDRYGRFGDAGNYRPLARHPELRRIFMQLPRGLRGSSHFGDDILPGTALARTLRGQEVPYLSEQAQALVFDGPSLLHRGSLVREGERMALQVGFKNRNEAIIRSRLANETFLREQIALGRKYARKYVMAYL
jgi:hypothetical protein